MINGQKRVPPPLIFQLLSYCTSSIKFFSFFFSYIIMRFLHLIFINVFEKYSFLIIPVLTKWFCKEVNCLQNFLQKIKFFAENSMFCKAFFLGRSGGLSNDPFNIVILSFHSLYQVLISLCKIYQQTRYLS